ncbi:unnamed protein product [Lactuca saligna]|uniref:Gamma-tubulin complex component n=1 Tax=Lactuca saligna TaxID=75948 RepID=A0AA35YA86_LACSI|nr:unnamed protein product [Lactuca saligna]
MLLLIKRKKKQQKGRLFHLLASPLSIDAVSSPFPSTPQWNYDRRFLTGQFHQDSKGHSVDIGLESEKLIGCYNASVQELIVIDDLLSGLVGIEGRYISINRVGGNDDSFIFNVDGSMDLALQVPALENSKLMNFGSNDHYLECIKSAYDFASGELLNLMKDKYDLIGKLRSIKHYLLLDQGDFLVHFMDIARDELDKTPNEISVEKLQSLLDLALRSTAAAADPLHEDVTCSVDTGSLLKRLSILKDLQTGGGGGEIVSEAVEEEPFDH